MYHGAGTTRPTYYILA